MAMQLYGVVVRHQWLILLLLLLLLLSIVRAGLTRATAEAIVSKACRLGACQVLVVQNYTIQITIAN